MIVYQYLVHGAMGLGFRDARNSLLTTLSGESNSLCTGFAFRCVSLSSCHARTDFFLCCERSD